MFFYKHMKIRKQAGAGLWQNIIQVYVMLVECLDIEYLDAKHLSMLSLKNFVIYFYYSLIIVS